MFDALKSSDEGVEPGNFSVMVGAASTDVRRAGEFEAQSK
jgi:hypothetical protein